MEEPYLIAEVTQLDRPTEQGMYNNFLLSLSREQTVGLKFKVVNGIFIFSE